MSADLPGTIDKIHFESGQWVHEGDILVELDTRQERAQLGNPEAQRDFAKVSHYGRAQELDKAGVISHSGDTTTPAPSRKPLRRRSATFAPPSPARRSTPPFRDLLGIRQVSLGQYLAAGQSIVSLRSLSPNPVRFRRTATRHAQK